MALVPAKTPHRAARRLRHRLGARLPIDVITTHYPDADAQGAAQRRLPARRHAAIPPPPDRAQQTPERFVELALHRALAQHAGEETDRLDRAVQQLLAHTTPAYLLSAVGHALTRTPERPHPA